MKLTALLIALVLTACGGGSPENDQAPTPRSTAHPGGTP